MNPLNNKLALYDQTFSSTGSLKEHSKKERSNGMVSVVRDKISSQQLFTKATAFPYPELTRKSQSDLRRCLQKLDPKNKSGLPKNAKQFDFTRLDVHTTNLIYRIDHASSTVAYFKIGKKEVEAGACLEKLIWKISKLMGLKHNLVRTKTACFSCNETNAVMSGSIQPAVRGTLLKDFIRNNDYSLLHVSDKELYLAIFTSYVLGMFDAHSANIMITPEGRIKFFDNAQSLPNANGLISWGANSWSVRSSYRCALLDHRERVSKILDPKERHELLEKARQCKQQLGSVNEYFDSAAGKSLTGKLPEGWLNCEGMMEAMEERIDFMIEHLESDEQLNMLELVVGNNFLYKLSFAVTFVAYQTAVISPNSTREALIECGSRSHGYVCNLPFSQSLQKLNSEGWSLDNLIDICGDAPEFPDMISEIVEKMLHKQAVDKSKNAYANYSNFAKIAQDVPYDLKEQNEAIYEKRVIEDHNKNELRKLGFAFHFINSQDQTLFEIRDKKFIVQNIADFRTRLCIWTNVGLRMKYISLSNMKGAVDVSRGSQVVTIHIEELENEMFESNGDPLIDEFPTPYTGVEKTGLFRVGNEIQILQYAQKIYIFFTNKEGKVGCNPINSNKTRDLFEYNNSLISLYDTITTFLHNLRESKK